MEDPQLLSYLFFVVFCVVSGSIIQWAASKINSKLPVSILWLLYGALLCVLDIVFAPMRQTNSFDKVLDVSPDDKGGLTAIGIAEFSRLPHNALYFILLPILLYDATQQIDWYYFRKNLRNGCALAISGIILQVFVIGSLMKLVSGGDLQLSFAAWVMISSGVGATDPIAVLSVLEHMDAPKHLSSLFDCESLINDGSAVFLFQFFRGLARGNSIGVRESTLEFLRLLLLAPIVGLTFALVLYRCVRHFRFYVYDVSLLIVGVAYMVFLVSEIYVHTSGPIAIVVYGIYFKAYGRAGLDHDANRTHRIFVKGLGVCGTSLVFIITGITCVRIFWDSFTGDNNLLVGELLVVDANAATDNINDFWTKLLWNLPLFYFVCHVARGAMVIVFAPLIQRDLGSFSWKEALLLWWGGLRGGVCLIVALLIEQDETIPRRIRSLASLYLAATTVLILLINGSTFEWFYRKLQPFEQNPFKALYLLKVLKFIDTEFEEEARLLQDHWLFAESDVLTVSKSLVPRLGSISVSSAQCLHFPTVCVRSTMRSLDLSKCSFRAVNVSERANRTRAGEPFASDVLIASSSFDDDSVFDGKMPSEVASQEEPMSSSLVSLTVNQPPQVAAGGGSRGTDGKSPVTQSRANVSDLQEPLLKGSPSYTSNSVRQPLYRVAAYSGGYTYRNRMERCTRQLSSADDGVPATWMESPVRSVSGGVLYSEENTPQSSWSTHFLGPTHCRNAGASAAIPDHSVLSPNAAIKIKTVLTWEREGEVSVMVTNSARHLYRRMYEQCFVSGDNYMNLMAVGDLVNDFCVTRGKPGKQKLWHKIIARNCILEKRLQTEHDKKLQSDLLKLTPFDLEWMLMCRKLHMCSNWELPVYNSIQRRQMWWGWLRRMMLRWWSVIGSRQTFPALDDLQALCAYVDVHEEMLLRGNQGLKFILGQHLLDSYVRRARLTQTAVVHVLQEVYPESFKYALICHGAIFLINLKIQLVEEYSERGLLMSSDCEIILNTLKRQLVKVMKFQPST